MAICAAGIFVILRRPIGQKRIVADLGRLSVAKRPVIPILVSKMRRAIISMAVQVKTRF